MIETKLQPMVSISCITFNHEKFIRDAIEGFIYQETNFPIEIIIHDDASTDGTTDIIREYEIKYPDLIKPIYQIENQYSRGRKISLNYVWPKCQGKYIALCEGDDCWTDPLKLQKQVDLMEHYPKCNISFHPDLEHFDDGSHQDRIGSKYSEIVKLFSVEDVILGGGGFMPTASIMIKTSVLKNLPDWFNQAIVGDAFVQAIGSEPSGALFIPDVMSRTNRNTPGSWTTRMKFNKDQYIKYHHEIISSYENLDHYFNHRYASVIKKKKIYYVYHLLKNYNLSFENRNAFFHGHSNLLPSGIKILLAGVYKNKTIDQILSLFVAAAKTFKNFIR